MKSKDIIITLVITFIFLILVIFVPRFFYGSKKMIGNNEIETTEDARNTAQNLSQAFVEDSELFKNNYGKNLMLESITSGPKRCQNCWTAVYTFDVDNENFDYKVATEIVDQQVSFVGDPILIQVGFEDSSNPLDHARIEIQEYPNTSNLEINTLLHNYMQDALQKFKDTIVSQPIPENYKNTFFLAYQIYPFKNNIESIRFDLYQYLGGEYGNTSYQTFVYNKVDGRRILLEDMFSQKEDALRIIATKVRDDLLETLVVDEYVSTGTSENWNNFRHFVFEEDAITFFFEPLQVSSFEEGSQSITVPLDLIQSLLTDEWKGIIGENISSTDITLPVVRE